MAKKTSKKTPATSKLTVTKTEAPMLVTRPAEPTIEKIDVQLDRNEIAALAFAKFAERGYTHGHAVDDWLSAEAELRSRKS